MSHQSKNILGLITPEIKADMETIHFCADLHHGHPKIIDICNRPVFLKDKDVAHIPAEKRSLKFPEYKRLRNAQHDEWLVKEVINKWVQKNHSLYLLGDVSMAKRVDAEKFLDRLNGNISQ